MSLDERVDTLIMEDQGGDPTEDGFIQRSGSSIRARLGGVVRSFLRQVVAGAGMTGGGSGDSVTVGVGANADGSIVVNAADVQVGVINDTQHGERGGGPLHPIAVANGTHGFLSGTDKAKLDGLGNFGQEFQYVVDLTLSSTTSNLFQTKLTLTTTNLPAGNYILFYSYIVGGSNNNTQIESRVRQDSTTDLFLVNQKIGIADGRFVVGGHEVLMFLAAGVYTFDIEWRRSAGSGSASIEQAHLTFWRIS